MRLLLGWLRNVYRRKRWPRGERSRESHSSGQSRKAVPQGAFRALHDWGSDPRVTKTAMMADLFLPLKPRSDIALINGLIHILIRTGLFNRDYIEQHTSGFAELQEFIQKYTPEYVSQVSGLSKDQILKTAY